MLLAFTFLTLFAVAAVACGIGTLMLFDVMLQRGTRRVAKESAGIRRRRERAGDTLKYSEAATKEYLECPSTLILAGSVPAGIRSAAGFGELAARPR